MKLHRSNKRKLSYKDAVAMQNGLRASIIYKDVLPKKIRTVAGVDVSYDKNSDIFFASIVCLRYKDLEILESVSAKGRVSFPYIPGLLSFREGPVVLKAFKKLKTKPDVMVFDGHGISHPRKMGIASHMGIILNMPTVGCAKSKLTGNFKEPGPKKGSSSPLLNKDGERIGLVLRTRTSVKPLFVSTGHMVSLNSAKKIAMKCTDRYRLPEPTRQAHIMSNRARIKG